MALFQKSSSSVAAKKIQLKDKDIQIVFDNIFKTNTSWFNMFTLLYVHDTSSALLHSYTEINKLEVLMKVSTYSDQKDYGPLLMIWLT